MDTNAGASFAELRGAQSCVIEIVADIECQRGSFTPSQHEGITDTIV